MCCEITAAKRDNLSQPNSFCCGITSLNIITVRQEINSGSLLIRIDGSGKKFLRDIRETNETNIRDNNLR